MKNIVLIISFTLLSLNIFATTWYVKVDGDNNAIGTSWNTAYQTITKAISVSSDGDEIRIAQGTYTSSEQYIIYC